VSIEKETYRQKYEKLARKETEARSVLPKILVTKSPEMNPCKPEDGVSGTQSQGPSPYRLVMKRETKSASMEIRSFEKHLEDTQLVRTPSPENPPTKAHFRLLRANDSECVFESRTDGEILTTTSSQSLVRLVWSRGSRPRKILIVRKPHDELVEEKFREIATYLHSDLNLEVYAEPAVVEDESVLAALPFLKTWVDEDSSYASTYIDLVISIGGDGTLLWASHLFKRAVPPIMSFAMGSLGFLTPFNTNSFKENIQRVVEEGCNLSLRSRLVARIIRNGRKSGLEPWGYVEEDSLGRGADFLSSRQRSICGIKSLLTPNQLEECYVLSKNGSGLDNVSEADSSDDSSSSDGEGDDHKQEDPTENQVFVALNEVLVDRGPSLHLTNLDCYVDDVFLTKAQADGIIIATPTGSTAYSLSAGGPMLHPEVPGICFTPICPHSLSFRPMILPDSSVLRLVVSTDTRSSLCVSFDGRNRHTLYTGDAVEVKMGRYPVPSVCDEDETEDWFHAVSTVLQWNYRTHQKSQHLFRRPNL